MRLLMMPRRIASAVSPAPVSDNTECTGAFKSHKFSLRVGEPMLPELPLGDIIEAVLDGD